MGPLTGVRENLGDQPSQIGCPFEATRNDHRRLVNIHVHFGLGTRLCQLCLMKFHGAVTKV